jgi:hypothetical protein
MWSGLRSKYASAKMKGLCFLRGPPRGATLKATRATQSVLRLSRLGISGRHLPLKTAAPTK